MAHMLKPKKLANYLLLIPVPMRRISSGIFAVESAFGDHLLMLKNKLEPKFGEFVIVAPDMREDLYEQSKGHLIHINESHAGIRLVSLHTGQFRLWCFIKACFSLQYYREVLTVLRLVRNADLIHAGPLISYLPTALFYGLIYAVLTRKKTIFVWDIDLRQSYKMLCEMGRTSLKDRFLLYFLYNTFLHIQIRLAVAFCSLVFLKSKAMIAHYSRGHENVKWFLNPGFKVKTILDSAYPYTNVVRKPRFAEKIKNTHSKTLPLELVYFGRLVSYKGVDFSIRAVKLAKQAGANIRFSIIGEGEEKENLIQLVDKLSLNDTVKFYPTITYGEELFNALYRYQILLATPFSEDTPRSALDAMACGMGVLAFDTSYYKNDIYDSAAVRVVAWPSVENLAETICCLDNNRGEVVQLMENALEYAAKNTQEIWLNKRAAWTFALFNKE